MTPLLVAVGAALGAVARHLVTRSLRSRLGATAVGAVLVVNTSGSLVLGLVAGHASGAAPVWLLPLLGIGFCGAYTTFATHAVEVVTAVRAGRTRQALLDLGLNLGLGLALVTLGWSITS